MNNMNKQIAMNVLAKIIADYKGNGSGSIKLKDFGFAVKGEGEFQVEEIQLVWDFKDVTCTKAKGEFKTSGTSVLKLIVKGIELTHHKGDLSLGEIEINSVDELQNLVLILPMDDLKKFFF